MLNNKINLSEVDKIGKISKEEKDFRIKNLNYFNDIGFPNKTYEDWKFTDLKEIFLKNFSKLNFNSTKSEDKKIDLVKNFDHNYIITFNGELASENFQFEDKSKIKIEPFKNNNFLNKKEANPLINLNHALSDKGYFLSIDDNYKFKKVLIIYNIFTKNLHENFLNQKNKIVIGNNSELHSIELTISKSKKKFFNNVYENLELKESAVLKNIYIQNNRNDGYFHKSSNTKLFNNSSLSSYIFPSGPKFNKFDLEFDLSGKNCECNLQAATFLNKNEHQEIKTRMNHFFPNCKSYQKVKKVLCEGSKGVYQGKIFVKNNAQKTDAYQLSKAILLNDKSEFNSKPELEIYADDVKCSHGSTSGSIDEDSIYYLMTRGLNREESIKLLVDGFLKDVTESIKSVTIKDFINNKLKDQCT